MIHDATATQYVIRVTLQQKLRPIRTLPQTNRPRVQRLPDDHALDAVGGVSGQGTDVFQAGDAAAGDDLEAALARQGSRRGHVDAGQGAIAGDVGEDDPQYAQVSHAPRHGQRVERRRLQPAVRRHHAIPHVDPDDDPLGAETGDGLRHHLRLPHCDRPQHNPRRAQHQGPRHIVHSADATAELDRQVDRGPNFRETPEVEAEVKAKATATVILSDRKE